ncbi:hypothetical protein [Halomonas rhizosphaerae]|uniref:Uncharacterized protein n=1 Tax=Halomonas rhizosphaerae TaxID=3043296 RepID=A0ABT6UXF1_9GAMM|nr:hypothetical protein [Halomonas rhizosphaerae]MDI5890650.1 hypothetical protein [Halomonas rhizosphaerae]
MTTWLPAICVGIVVLCTLWLASDPAFAHGRDRALGGAIGFVGGLVIAAIVFAMVRAGAWAMGVGS